MLQVFGVHKCVRYPIVLDDFFTTFVGIKEPPWGRRSNERASRLWRRVRDIRSGEVRFVSSWRSTYMFLPQSVALGKMQGFDSSEEQDARTRCEPPQTDYAETSRYNCTDPALRFVNN